MAKCSECGFISARAWKAYGFFELDDKARANGKVGSDLGGREPVPVCFVNSFDIKEEVEILRKAAHDEPTQDAYGHTSPHWETYVEQVLNTERACESFIKWQ